MNWEWYTETRILQIKEVQYLTRGKQFKKFEKNMPCIKSTRLYERVTIRDVEMKQRTHLSALS